MNRVKKKKKAILKLLRKRLTKLFNSETKMTYVQRKGKNSQGNKLNESLEKILILRSIKKIEINRLIATERKLILLDNIQW